MRAVPIIRSRTGCFTCRRRKKKCNEEKPMCSGCKRNKLECTWPAERPAQVRSAARGRGKHPPLPTRSASLRKEPAGQSLPQQNDPLGRNDAASTLSQTAPTSPDDEARYKSLDEDLPCSAAPEYQLVESPASSSRSAAADGSSLQDDLDDSISDYSSSTTLASLAAPELALESSPGRSLGIAGVPAIAFVSAKENSGRGIDERGDIPMNMSLLPAHGHDSFELLSYYLSRTANSMGNGSTDVNPFVAKMIPLAFSDPLVLHLILAQSAVHRQASEECGSGGEVATRYYTESLRMFRGLVNEYVLGKEDKNLVVAVGSLICCLTEVAKGDTDGTIFDHLSASRSLLTSLLARHSSSMFDDLPDFLVEYYMHMYASSMITKDPRSASHADPSPSIDDAVKKLLAKNYIGQLCGCWLEILTLIPQVFRLGQSILRSRDEPEAHPTPDHVITFGLLQSQILSFMPVAVASNCGQLAGLVFKQATLLYLWSIFGTPHQNDQTSMHSGLMNSAVMEAVSVLNQLPASERVNTSLCWPLTVIGCCTPDADVQNLLRLRLQAMIVGIGLGNMRQTLTLLEHVWAQPPELISPWTLRSIMEQHRIWISFA